MAYKSYSQKKREKFDYRRHYIEHNKGILGKYYICSQCFKVLRRSEMQVDHIFPVSKRFVPNRVINCVAICGECNRHKSDKVEFKLQLKGIIAKLLEEFGLLLGKLLKLLKEALFLAIAFLIRLILSPIFTARSAVQVAVIGSVYVYFIVSLF